MSKINRDNRLINIEKDDLMKEKLKRAKELNRDKKEKTEKLLYKANLQTHSTSISLLTH